jgi:hypothetical protein
LKETIILSGMIAGDPHQGGATWAVLQYMLGLQQLGYDVVLIEPVKAHTAEREAYFRTVARDFDLQGRWSLLREGSQEALGLSYPQLQNLAGRAAALINISGMLRAEDLIRNIPVRIYLDLDPAFNQLWHATHSADMHFDLHNQFVTVGKAIGQPDCSVPTCGHKWLTTFPPVVLDWWDENSPIRYEGLTTVANWRSYGSIDHNGVLYGQKVHSLRQFIELPNRTSERFMPALAIDAGERNDLETLARNRWELLDPFTVAGTPQNYANFIRTSKAEFGIAKSGYVISRCGWFSDRSACYLACGRPVIAQDTEFSAYLPCGEGLLSFRTSEEALGAIDALNGNYDRHSRAARAIAHEYLDSTKVLPALLAGVGIG